MPASVNGIGLQDPANAALQNASPELAGMGSRIGRPRKPGAKSRDTTRFKKWTGYLMHDTVNEAEYLLKRTKPDGTRDPRDMSDLIQDLLAAWVTERAKPGPLSVKNVIARTA